MKKYTNGIAYFFIHLLTEIICFYIISSYFVLPIALAIALIYDFLAFVPQGLFGYVLDSKIKIPMLPIGIGLLLVALVLFRFNITAFVTIIILSIGNALIHICGAERTLRCSPGKMTNSSLFVGGGSFGVLLGKLADKFAWNWHIVLGLCLIMIVPAILYLRKPINYDDETNLNKYEFASKKIKPVWIIILATLVVAVRAYVGYGIPTSWNQELYQTILLYCFMGLGKAIGGIFIDKLGIKITALIATIGSIPFLCFGDKIMILSLIGVMMFSMTMAITLAILVSTMKSKPGVAFGMTTIGLFLGSAPVLFFGNPPFIVNIILIIVLSALCAVTLIFISNSKKREGEKKDE